jgi:hypothetical protein
MVNHEGAPLRSKAPHSIKMAGRPGMRGAGVVVAMVAAGICAASVIIASARPVLQGGAPAVLLSAFPQPAYYPEPFVIAHGSMLAADPDADSPDEAEDEAEGKELSDLESEVDEETRKEFQNYHVVPLNEVFAGESSDNAAQRARGTGSDSEHNSIELDSTTLAEIYTKQAHYSKALGIYRRLLRLAPHNDLLRLKVAELSRLDANQRREDLEADPVMYDRMEVVEIIDRQIRYFTTLLVRIDGK